MSQWNIPSYQNIDALCCLRNTCLPCLALYEIREALVGDTIDRSDPILNCGIGCCIPPYIIVANAFTMGEVRRKHNIIGNFAHDLLMSFLCLPCALHQVKHELHLRKDSSVLLTPPHSEQINPNSYQMHLVH